MKSSLWRNPAFHSTLIASVAAAGLAVIPVESGHAQESDEGALGTIEEVVVTARRREESLQEVPISVTAFSQEALREQDILSTEELSEVVPNLRINEGPRAGSNQFTIRGVTRQGPGGDPTTSAGVGLYLNGVYIPAGIANHLSLHDIERLEVLRGPQGTLFGKNTTGGAINVATRRPGPEPEGEVLLRTGSHDRQDARVMVNGPIGENVYGRISAAMDKRDGYYENLLLGTTHNDRNVRTVDAALRWEPNQDLTFDLTARYMDRNENNNGGDCRFIEEVGYHQIHEANGGGNFEEACRESEAAGTYKFYSAWPMYLDAQHESVTAEVEWQAPGSVGMLDYLNISANTGYFEVNYSFLVDSHYTRELLETRGTHGGGQTEEYTHFELLFEGGVGMADLLFGLNWYDTQGWQHKESFDTCYDLYDSVFGTGVSVTCPSPGGFFFNNQPYNTSGSGPAPFFGNVEATSETLSAFFHAKLALTDWFRLDAGARYTNEERTFRNFEGDVTPRGDFLDWEFVMNDDTIGLFGEGDDTWSEITPTISANFLFEEVGPIEDGMAYAMWSRGFTSGGFNSELDVRGVPELAPLQTFDPEILDNYEIGLKTSLFERRLQVNLAVFRMEYSDKQESIAVDNSDGRFGPNTSIEITSNAAEATIEGFELEFIAILIPGLRIDGGLAQQKPRFSSFEGFDPSTGEVEDLTDLKLNTDPELTFTGNISYMYQLPNGGAIDTRVGVYWQDETDTAVAEFGRTGRTVCFQEDYTTLNARITYGSPGDHLSMSLFGRNLTDEEVLANCGLSNARGRWAPMYQDLSTWGLEAVYRF